MIALLTTRTKPHTPAMPDLKEYMTTEEAAAELEFHVATIRRMCREKDLEGLRVGPGWLVRRRSVAEYKKRTEGMDKRDPRRGNN